MKNAKVIFVIALILLAAACKSEKEILQQKIEHYWQLRIAKNFTESYKYEYPVFKKKVDFNTYVSSRSNPFASYKQATIKEIKLIKPDLAEVDMVFKIELRFPPARKPIEVKIKRKEKWVKVDGKWYHVPVT